MTAKYPENYLLPLPLILYTLLAGGCASTAETYDPFEDINRGIYALNSDLDNALMKPVAETYRAIVPDPVDKGVTNFFSNIDDVIVIVNDILQLKPRQAGSAAGRFLINSTIGVLGLFDFATDWGMPKHYEDFGQTLGYWGMNSGPYIVLPFFGPSSVRDAGGRVVDMFSDPRVYVHDHKARTFVLATNVLSAVDTRADLLDKEQVLNTVALDQYAFVRDAYTQRRNFLVHDGNLPMKEEELDGLFDDLEGNQPETKKAVANAEMPPDIDQPSKTDSPSKMLFGYNIYLEDIEHPLIPYPQ